MGQAGGAIETGSDEPEPKEGSLHDHISAANRVSARRPGAPRPDRWSREAARRRRAGAQGRVQAEADGHQPDARSLEALPGMGASGGEAHRRPGPVRADLPPGAGPGRRRDDPRGEDGRGGRGRDLRRVRRRRAPHGRDPRAPGDLQGRGDGQEGDPGLEGRTRQRSSTRRPTRWCWPWRCIRTRRSSASAPSALPPTSRASRRACTAWPWPLWWPGSAGSRSPFRSPRRTRPWSEARSTRPSPAPSPGSACAGTRWRST